MTTLRLVLLLGIVALGAFLMSQTQLPFVGALQLILALLTGLWLLSLALKDASIVDSFWGLGFAILAWYAYFNLGNASTKNLVLCGMVTVWALRLSLYIGIRNHGKGEDYRYQVFRKEAGKHFWWVSFLRVFMLQGVLLWLIAAPLVYAQPKTTAMGLWEYLGIILWLIGFGFETIGDYQLATFKANPANAGKVMNQGLWYYTRHPNYFGDALLWWGYFCFAVGAGAWFSIFSPILMTFLLMKVSGVALLEQTLTKTKPAYKTYIEQTSAFLPMPPKKD
jgi:steroid 5-alpha reductase family enzyme